MPAKNNISLLRQDIEYLKKEEIKNRRKLRLLQVRQQNRQHATKVRHDVQKKKCDEIVKIAHMLDQKHQEEMDMKIETAQKAYLDGLGNFGAAYANVKVDETLKKQAKEDYGKNKILALERYKEAVTQLKETENIKNQDQLAYKTRKNLVRNREKLRAKKVANLPKPLKPEDDVSETTKRNKSTSAFSQSHHSSFYHAAAVRHEGDYDAKLAAEKEEQIMKGLSTERSCTSLAMKEKAYLRHKAAVSQERLNQDLLELEKEIQQLRRKEQFRK